MPIETVLFDYSGLLTTSLQMPAVELAYDADALMTEMIAGLASPDPHPWHELERGEISLDAFVDYIESKVPGAGVLFAADSEHNAMAGLALLPERMAVVEAVKSGGMRVGLVTNNVAEWEPLWMPRLPAGLFEVVIDSAAVGHRKPEPRIYELAMSLLCIDDPATVLFVDDFEWNVAGATAIGMVGRHVTSDADLGAIISEAIG